LRLLVGIAPRDALHLEVAHFDHALRPESGEDARFVAELAARFGLEVHVSRWARPVRGEDAARRARHAFLEETALRLGCDAIALAHHLDDQIETILLRLSRGTGVRGWLGMGWRRQGRVPIVRPLLDLRRSALVSYLEALEQTWCEDSSNRDLRLARNRVRHEALPALDRSLEGGWPERWAESVEDLREIWTWLEARAVELLEAARVSAAERGVETAEEVVGSCDLRTLRAAPTPILRAALQRWAEGAGATDVSRPQLTTLTLLVRKGQSGQSVDLCRGMRFALEQGQLTLLRDTAPTVGHSSGGQAGSKAKTAEPLAAGIGSALEVANLDLRKALAVVASPGARGGARPEPDATEAVIAADALQPPFELRGPRPGDRVRLLGAPGNRKLSRILQDRRVPARLRASWPVVSDSLGVVWIPGIGVAERARLTPASRAALRLRLPARREPASA
jgi:tRNA(Ile)-lysidine synthase